MLVYYVYLFTTSNNEVLILSVYVILLAVLNTEVIAVLMQIMGEHSYSLEFHEPPPGPDTLAVAEAEALAAEELAAAASVTGVAAERDAALLQAADAKASVAGAHEAAEKAIAAAVAAASDARNEAEASAAAKVAAVEVSMATAHQEIEQLRGKMAEMEGVAAQLKAEAASKAEEAGASALELQAVREELAAAVAAKEEALAAATAGTATRDVHLIELQQQLAAAEEAAAATTAELATAKESAAAAIASAAAEAAAAHEMLAASQAEVEAVKAQLAEKLASAASLQAQVDELVTAQQTLQAEAASALEARDAAANEAAEQVAEAKRAAQSEAEKAATLEEMLSQTLEQLKLAEAGQAAAGVAANGGGEEVSSPEGAGGETDGLPTTPSKPKGDLLHELVASRVEVAELKQQNDELLSQVAALSPDRVPAAGGGTPLRGTPAVAEAALLAEADEYSEEDDDDDMVVMNIDSNGQPRTPLFQGAGAEGTEGVSPEALGLIVDKIIAARQAGGEAGSGGDTALYEQAVAMLQAELVKLGKEVSQGRLTQADLWAVLYEGSILELFFVINEILLCIGNFDVVLVCVQMVGKEDHVARLRAEVGSLQTAQMSAEQTAAVLEDYNRMSMKVAALQQQLVQRENEYFRCEASLLQDISVLNAKAKRRKGKGALKSLSKAAKVAMTSTTNAVTSTIRELQKPFDGAAEGQQPKSVSPYGKLLGLGKRWNSNQNLPRTSPERPLGAGMRS